MRVGIALGSNLGDRLTNLRAARDHLRELHEDRGPFLCSRIHESEPFECPSGSPLFWNAAIEIACTIPPLDLLAKLQLLEQRLGRPAGHGFHTPRSIDLDILYYDNLEFTLPDLTLPHPRIAGRPFVLAPLAEVCPDRILPGWKVSVRSRLAECLPQDLPRVVAVF